MKRYLLFAISCVALAQTGAVNIISGTADLSGATAVKVPNTSTGDASTKAANTAALSQALASVNPAANVQAATIAVLPNTPTYNNGTAGVGATLTAGSNGALTIDGYAVLLNDRILVKNQASSFQNGFYTETTLGTGGVPYVLTRATDYNAPSNINYTGSALILQGSTLNGQSWHGPTNIVTVGTDAIPFAQDPTPSASPGGGSVKAAGTLVNGNVITGGGGKTIQDSGTALTALAPKASPTFTGTVNASGATHTLPTIVVASTGALPATCTAGELAVVTGATLGQQLYQCSAGNVWTQQLNSGTATGGGITMYSATGLTVTANTYYLPIGGGGSASTTETNVDIDSPAAATITNMFVQQSVAIGAGNSAVYTFRKNATSQSVTCTIAGASATSCSDSTHSFNVSQGDLLTIQLVTTGTIVVTPNILIAAQFGNITATGTVNSGTINQLAYYAASGAAVSTTSAIPSAITATTQSANDNSTKIATTAYSDTPVSLPTPGSTCTFAGKATVCVCTTTCTITVPVPAAGDQYCVLNDDNVSTVITLSAIGSSARYENQARTAYGTAGTGTLVSAGAVKDFVCILGRDSTHYLFASGGGTWTAN